MASARAARRDSSAAGRDPDSILPSAWRCLGAAPRTAAGAPRAWGQGAIFISFLLLCLSAAIAFEPGLYPSAAFYERQGCPSGARKPRQELHLRPRGRPQ